MAQSLARRHVRYGVKNAWIAAYTTLSQVMTEASATA